MVAQTIIIIWVHHIAYSTLHIVVVYIAPGYRHTIHRHDTRCGMVLITKWLWQAQCYVNVALGMKTLSDSEICSCKTTVYMRRILPAKH